MENIGQKEDIIQCKKVQGYDYTINLHTEHKH